MRNDPLPVVPLATAHESASLHVSGRARYTDDLPEVHGTLHAAIGYAASAHALIEHLDLSEVQASPGVVRVLTARDIPGQRRLGLLVQDEPLLAQDRIEYWGQPLFLVVAESVEAARRAARQAKVGLQPLPVVTDARLARERGQSVAPERVVVSGDPEAALARAPLVCSGAVEIGGQEHFYLEGQISYAVPGDDGNLTLHVSTQHPSEMQHMAAQVLGWPKARITVLCRRMGGAFGGKESQSGVFACLAALAATTTGRPVKLRLDRDDDFLITGKRHDFRIDFRVAASATGVIEGLAIEHLLRCGYSADYSGPVGDRAVFHATNAYYVENLHCRSFRARTNTQSNTAFRGFGGPQAVLGMELAIEALALRRGEDALDVRLRNLYGKTSRNRTHYGWALEDNVLPELVAQLERSSGYRQRRREVDAFNAGHAILKKGLALMPVAFGVGFGATTFLNQGGALVQVYADGSIQVNHGGTEMGQGLNTKVAQVVAHEFGLPLSAVQCTATDTGKVPNTVSTAASSGTDLNARAAQNAALELKERLAALAARLLDCPPAALRFAGGRVGEGTRSLSFAELCAQAFLHQVSLSATGYYKVPKVSFDLQAFEGRPFLYYVYGAACSEVLVDTLTGEMKVLRVDILQDAGESLNPALDRGQVEGGFVQGMGWLTSEELVWRDDGFLATHAPQTYKIPTSRDVPADFRVDFFENSNAEDTIHRSKAIGEPPLKLAVSVYLAILDAVMSATGRRELPQLRAPATPEAILMAISGTKPHFHSRASR
jgi:xanthine dehydrogenase large subunit